MEIGEIISDSVKYPTSDWTKIIILAVILIIPIVNFIGIGYVIRIMKGTLAGLDDLPDFDEVGELFIDGLKLLVVGIVYAIPIWIISAILGAIIGLLSPASTVTYMDTTSTALFATMIASYAAVFVAAIIVGLIEIVAILNMAYYDGDLGAAFRFSDILNYISTIGWGKYIITYIVIALICAVIMAVAGLVGVILIGIGLIITMPLAMSFCYMFGARAITTLFSDALGETA
ncbi:MAG: DUF4013 domain-containing protein [Methanobacterium sp.]|nr:DUF4013 domain-containing protein [Methanobacterium sp.]